MIADVYFLMCTLHKYSTPTDGRQSVYENEVYIMFDNFKWLHEPSIFLF